jgi:hypothetical protein
MDAMARGFSFWGRLREHPRTVPVDLRTLFELEPGPQGHRLETFISDRLFEAGAWGANNCPDGVVHIRVLESEPDRLRLCGRLFEINGQLHPFWLELEQPASGTAVTWSLYVDVVATTPRRARDAIDLFDRASAIEWIVALSGKAEVRDGALVPLP